MHVYLSHFPPENREKDMTWRRGKKAHSLWLYDLVAFPALHFWRDLEGNGGPRENERSI